MVPLTGTDCSMVPPSRSSAPPTTAVDATDVDAPDRSARIHNERMWLNRDESAARPPIATVMLHP
ncbi:MAG: hypothetical protein AB7S71_19840 [Dongiaceae bacterium]